MLEQVIETLASWYMFDLWVFSQWWMYAPLFIPITLYLVFFLTKWLVLTLPIWLPFVHIIKLTRKD